jgi:carboxymethylenebutenolidase
MDGTMTAETVRLAGHGGDEIEAYLARPGGDAPRGGVVVIHHLPGYDRWSREVARRFAADLGYDAIVPNLHHREAPGADPDDASAAVRAAGGVPDERLVGDVGAAAAYLRDLGSSNGTVGTIGYCSGGRQSFLAAISLDIDAAIDCYGAFVVGTPPSQYPIRVAPLIDRAAELRCPLLGLFGADDSYPSPEQNAQLEQALKAAGKDYEFHTYEGAGHAFFAADRPSYRPEAAVDGWRKVEAFLARHLSA